MIAPVRYERGEELFQPSESEIAANINRILDSSLAGFVIKETRKSYKQACATVQKLGFQGNSKASVPFEHDAGVSRAITLLRGGNELPGNFRDYGVTQLHADGDVEDEMLSIIKVKRGALEIRAFERGEALADIDAVDLFDVLEPQTTLLLRDHAVNTDLIRPRGTIISASAGDTIIFDPSQPHMAITTQGPRISDSTFFQR